MNRLKCGTLLGTLFISCWARAATPPGLPLNEVYAAALSHSETLARQKERVTQARERTNQVRGGILPNLSLNASHLLQERPTNALAREFFPEKQTSASLTLSQPLFRGLREFAGLRQQKNLLAGQLATEDLTRAQLLEDVGTSFFTILSLEQDIRNLEAQAELYRKRIQDLRGRVRRGESNSTDLLTAQATESALLAELDLLKGQLRGTRQSFHYLTGLAQDTRLTDDTLEASIRAAKTVKLEDLLGRIEHRPDVRAALEQVEAARENVKVQSGAHWPTIDAVGNYYLKRPDGPANEIDWDVQVRLTLPLYEGGTTQARTREAVSARTESELALAQLKRQAERDIRTFHESARSRAESLEALARAAELAGRNSQQLERDYRRGLARNIDVQAALTEARVSQRTLDQARFALRLDLLRLDIAAARSAADAIRPASDEPTPDEPKVSREIRNDDGGGR